MNWPAAVGIVAIILLLAAMKLGRFVFAIGVAALVLLAVAGIGIFRKRQKTGTRHEERGPR